MAIEDEGKKVLNAVEEVVEELVMPEKAAKKTKKAKKVKKRFYKHVDVNNGVESFASGLNIYKILWVFIIGCVIGVVVESFYVYAVTGEWMRRSGMLYGPFNQVSGFGAVLFTLLLYRYRDQNNFIIFLASGVMGLAFEFVCSWVQEKMFGSVSWEYSDMAMNIGGRTNLLYGAGWGLMGLIFITVFWPWMSEMIERIPNKVGKPLTWVISIALAVNLSLSALAVFREGERKAGVPATNAVTRWLDATYPDEVMQEKYPSMQFSADKEDTEENTAK